MLNKMLNQLPNTTSLIIFTALFNYNVAATAAEPDNNNQPTTIEPAPDKASPVTISPVTTSPAANSPASTSAVETTSPTVERSQFTTAIVDREPTDNVVTLTNNSDKIYFFSELANLKGHTITHRWEYQGKLMAEIKFDVKSNHWRVYSSKNIKPGWTGEWTVELVDENGTPLDVENLQIVDAKSN